MDWDIVTTSADQQVRAVLLDLADDGVDDLLRMLASLQPQLILGDRTAADLEAWIRQREPLHLPIHVVASTRGVKCNAYILVSECSIEPRIVVTAALSDMERLLAVRSNDVSDWKGWFGSKSTGRRINAIKERIKRVCTSECTYGALEVDEVARTVYADGEKLRLTPTEYRLLRKFVRAPESVHSREILLNAISQDRYEVTDRSVDAHIKNLRRKIRNSAAFGIEISTVYGIGYKLEKRVDV